MSIWRKLKLLLVGFTSLIILSSLGSADAASANISRAYHASGNITNGQIVSLDPSRADYVIAANNANATRLLGVVVAENDSLLATDPQVGQIQVSTSGTTSTLASTLNGSINVGDQISVSPFNGVGMKAAPGSQIIGLAQTALNSSSPGSKLETVKNLQGKTSELRVGYVRLIIAVGINEATSSSKLNSLQKLVQQLTGRTVATARIIIAITITLIALAVLASLTYSAIYSSIIAIGRNPLTKDSVYRSLFGVILVSGFIALIAFGAVFFLLR